MVVTLDSARVTAVEHRALDVVRWARVAVDVSNASTFEDVGDAVQSRLNAACQLAGERLVAARVELVGASGVHAALKADPERATETVRAAALDVDGGSVWVERVAVITRPLREPSLEWARETGPLADLSRELAHLKDNPLELEAFLAELPSLAELSRKIRPLAGSGADVTLRPSAAVLDDALELLVARFSELAE